MKNYLNNLEKSVLSMMIDNLDDMEGREGYVSDLAFDLFESENATGSITCNAWAAEEWIGEHFHDLGDVVSNIQDEWGETLNPFASPETFQVQVVIFLAGHLIDCSDFVARRYEEECDAITYDAEIIEIIRREWEEALDA
jgi:hypothetical protein